MQFRSLGDRGAQSLDPERLTAQRCDPQPEHQSHHWGDSHCDTYANNTFVALSDPCTLR
eukprot:TRINITY_DN3740_c0_g1_i1.p1 TRINITY_DN3740_c0_g1~~TRINITY_DN3740_c0_g1_i1.p1  ORF type:complete len:59 (-),score=6.40 TRINITY_DN3740_c0_g1_i1:4-180(-)